MILRKLSVYFAMGGIKCKKGYLGDTLYVVKAKNAKAISCLIIHQSG